MMPSDDRYESWKRRRADVAAPVGFVDRVMQAVEEAEQSRRATVAGWMILLLRSRAVRIGVGAIAVLVCAARIAAVVALFLFPR
jgi:hypothetical protein